jgi:hypothetical protein
LRWVHDRKRAYDRMLWAYRSTYEPSVE